MPVFSEKNVKKTFTKTEYLRFTQTNDANRLFMLFAVFRRNGVRFEEDAVMLESNRTLPNDIFTKCYLIHHILYLADMIHGKSVKCPTIVVRDMVEEYEYLFRCEFSTQTEAFLAFDA